jgi:hypothetical protein
MLPQSTRAEPAVCEIRSLYSEYLVGEAVKLEVHIFNPPGNPALAIVKLSGAVMYPGSFDTELVEPNGSVLRMSRVSVRNHPAVLGTDLIGIAPGAEWRGQTSAFQLPRMVGKHIVRVTYRPNWKAPPEIAREIGINVIAAEGAILESKVSAPGYQGSTVEIVKVHTADGYWLYYRSRPQGALERLVQINEKATFSVSDRQPSDKALEGVCTVTYDLDGERRILVLYYGGTVLAGQLSPKE